MIKYKNFSRSIIGAALAFVCGAALVAPSAYALNITGSNILTPGVTIFQKTGGDRQEFCTLGWLAKDRDTGKNYALTAGHCYIKDSDPTVYYYLHTSDNRYIPTAIGKYVEGSYAEKSNGEVRTDHAVIELFPGVNLVGDVTGKYRVTSVDSVPKVQLLPKGTMICKSGAVSGETCGPLVSVSDGIFSAKLRNIPGDSGGPVYLRTDSGVVALGIVSGIFALRPDIMYATYIADVTIPNNFAIYD